MDDFLTQTLAQLQDAHAYRTLPTMVTDPRPGHIFNTNDYLGLNTEPGRLQAGLAAATAHGTGATGSRLLGGHYPTLTDLETALESRLGKSVLVVNSGYHANTGLLGCLPQRADLILADKACHASLLDGAKLSAATLKRFRHADYDHLAHIIHQNRSHYDQLFIVTESLFSMTGTACDFDTLIRIKHDARATVILDEAHAVGCYGPSGMGLADAHGVLDDIDIVIGTFGKAFSSLGAFIAGSLDLRHYLVNRCRSFIYSTALPPFVTGVNLASVTQNHTEKQAALAAITHYCHRQLSQYRDPAATHHIVPLPVGNPEVALAHADQLARQGLVTTAIRHPTVPKHQDLIRISLRADHTPEAIDALVHAWETLAL